MCRSSQHWHVNIWAVCLLILHTMHNLLLERNQLCLIPFPFRLLYHRDGKNTKNTHIRATLERLISFHMMMASTEQKESDWNEGILFSSGSKSNNNYLLLFRWPFLLLHLSLYFYFHIRLILPCHNSQNSLLNSFYCYIERFYVCAQDTQEFFPLPLWVYEFLFFFSLASFFFGWFLMEVYVSLAIFVGWCKKLLPTLFKWTHVI